MQATFRFVYRHDGSAVTPGSRARDTAIFPLVILNSADFMKPVALMALRADSHALCRISSVNHAYGIHRRRYLRGMPVHSLIRIGFF